MIAYQATSFGMAEEISKWLAGLVSFFRGVGTSIIEKARLIDDS